MLEALGRPASGRVLLPAPGQVRAAAPFKPVTGRLHIGYSGNLFDYGPAIGALADVMARAPEIQFTVRGRDPSWNAEMLARFSAAGLYQPALERDAYEAWAAELDAHLCILSFDLAVAARMRTSFPSKILEVLRFGRPVVLWGPEGSAGVQWAQATGGALTVTSPDPTDAMMALRALATDKGVYRRYSEAARKCAHEFSFCVLHQQFREHLGQVITTYPVIGTARERDPGVAP